MNKFEMKAQKTRASIIAAFWELTKEKDLSKINIKDVTERCGIYRSTFYLHFVDIVDLLEKEENVFIDRWIEQAQGISDQATPQDLLQLFSEYYRENSEKIFILLDNRGYSKFEPKMKAAIKETLHVRFPQTHTAEFDYTFEFVISGIIGSLRKWYADGQVESLDAVIARMLTLIQHGMGDLYWNRLEV